MLVALRVDTDRCNQDQIFVHVNAIDLDHQQIEAGEIGCHPILHARRRQRYEAAGGGRFRQTSPRRPRNVSLRQPNRSGKLARRDIDQHLVQGPLPEPVLRNCRLPTRYRLLLPVKAAKPWPLDFDLAAVEADLALRFPQRCARRSRPRACRGPQIACASRSIISPRASMPEARQNNSKLAEIFDRASSFSALVGIAVDVVSLFMALLSFVESPPRA